MDYKLDSNLWIMNHEPFKVCTALNISVDGTVFFTILCNHLKEVEYWCPAHFCLYPSTLGWWLNPNPTSMLYFLFEPDLSPTLLSLCGAFLLPLPSVPWTLRNIYHYLTMTQSRHLSAPVICLFVWCRHISITTFFAPKLNLNRLLTGYCMFGSDIHPLTPQTGTRHLYNCCC